MAEASANTSNEPEPVSPVRLALMAGLTGMLSGLVAAMFRLALEHAERWRDWFIAWAHGWSVAGLILLVGVLSGCIAIAAWLVRRLAPHAGGSGIPHVEAVVSGELKPAPIILLPVKFVGGLLAIGSGLALGREGPSVQMGASIAALLGKFRRLSEPDVRALVAAGAGAGLATAFNAPIAGAVFVLEEVVRRFEPRVAIAALAASAGAMGVARIFLGSNPDFQLPAMQPPGPGCVVLFALLGLVAGLAGAGYTKAILGTLQVADRLPGAISKWCLLIIGTGVAVVAWFAPSWVGGGEVLTQATLAGEIALRNLLLLFAIRFLFGAVSYAAGTPGGLFAPILVLGAQAGVLFAALCPARFCAAFPAAAFPLVGMAAFFVAVVGSPLTGIVLVAELSGGYNLFLPMLAASAAAMVVAKAVHSPPIYDVLKIRTLALEERRRNL